MGRILTSGYGDYTYNSKNPLKRFSHRSRFRQGLKLIQIKNDISILDFGCGDAMFLNLLYDHSSEKLSLVGYEPYLELIENNKITVLSDWGKVVEYSEISGKFDYVLCFEVLEHFSEERQKGAIEQIYSVLSDRGSFVVSVPIEKGFPALIKNVFRKRASSSTIYSYQNIWRSFLGKELPGLRQGDEYLSHMGFYFQDLEKLFSAYFIIEKRQFSPFKRLGYHVNSQVFYVLRKKEL